MEPRETTPPTHDPRDAKARAKADRAYKKASRPWYKKKRYLLPLAVVVLIAAFSSSGDSGTDSETPSAEDTNASASATAPGESSAAEEPAEAEQPAEKKTPKMTASQENAVRAAENYLSFAPFSKKGLIQQLSSQAGDGYPKPDAVFAVNHIDADWNKQAAIAAKNYLDISSFSRSGLIQQLSSAAGDKYTRAQAVYGVNKAGL